jgi:hypothetical protein
MRRVWALAIAGLFTIAPAWAQSVDLGVKTAGEAVTAAPYTGSDVIPLVRGTAWGKIVATILNPCTATLVGTVPTPPNDATKFLNGQCAWTTPAGGGGITIGSTSITGGTTGRLLYDNAGNVGEMSTLTAALFPALTGDVTTPGASLATTIANLAVTTAKLNTAAVTYAKIQNGASAGLLGVNNGSAPTEVAVGSGLSLSAGTLSATGGGATTGSGVDGGTSAQTLTAGATLSNGTRLVKIGSGWATGTVTLQAISAVSADTCVRIEDGGNFIDGSHTLTVKGGVSDGLNGGAANGTVGPFTTAGSFVIACVSAANNWNVGPGTIAASSAPSNQFANGVTVNGLTYAQPAVSNISGFGTGVATWLGTPSSANLAAALTDETGSGAAVFATSPTLVTPALGTPSSGVGTNITGIPNNNVLAASLAAGGNASLSGPREYYVCTGTCTVTPPVPAAGYEFCVMNDDNVATVITLAAIGSSARYEATARTSYGTAGTGTFVSGGAAGDKVCLVGRDSTHYLTTSFNGTWTAN